MCVSRMREPVGLRPDAEEKHTLNLSFNINPWLAKSLVSALYGCLWTPRAASFLRVLYRISDSEADRAMSPTRDMHG